MRIVIAGGHGKIALLLEKLLADAGHDPVALIRNPDHVSDVEAAGAAALLLDLESTDAVTLAAHLEGADAVVFAAGAGSGSGNERKLTVDRGGAILLADAAELAGIRRYILVSSMGADSYEPGSTDAFQVYLRAKGEADAIVRERDLDWTIVRPSGLSDGQATDRIRVGSALGGGSIPRADVAALLARVLLTGDGTRKQFEVTGGDDPLDSAPL